MKEKFAKAIVDHLELAGGLVDDELEGMADSNERDVLEEIQSRLIKCQYDMDDLLDAKEAAR